MLQANCKTRTRCVYFSVFVVYLACIRFKHCCNSSLTRIDTCVLRFAYLHVRIYIAVANESCPRRYSIVRRKFTHLANSTVRYVALAAAGAVLFYARGGWSHCSGGSVCLSTAYFDSTTRVVVRLLMLASIAPRRPVVNIISTAGNKTALVVKTVLRSVPARCPMRW